MSAMDLAIRISAINEAAAALAQTQQQIEAIQGMGNKMKGIGSTLQNVGMGMTALATVPIVGALGAATYAAVQFESTMADLNKAYGFDNGTQQAMEAQQAVQRLSGELRMMPADVASIGTEAGKLGVGFNQFEDYTRMVASASVAFDMTAEQAGSSLATLTNVLGYQDAQGRVNIEGLYALGDAINYFADTGATSEAAITQVLQRAGGSTRTFGLANDSAVALSAAFLNLGYAPEVVGTAMNSMLPQLQNATQQTPKFQEALEQIGLPAKEFEQMIKKDAVGALTTFMDAVQKSGDTSLISRMFGTGSDSAMMTSAIQNLDKFKATLLDTKNIDPGSMMGTFEKRMQTTESSLQGLKVAAANMAINVGSVLLPALLGIANALTPIVQGFADFASAHPGITKIGVAIALVVAAIGPLLMIIGSVVGAIGTITTAFAGIGSIGAIFAGLGTALATVGGFLATAAGAALSFVNAFLVLPALLAGVVYGIFAIGSAMTGTSLSIGTFTEAIKISLAELPANLMAIGPAIGAFVSLIGAQFTALGSVIRLAFTQALSSATAAFSGIMAAAGAAVSGTVARIVGGAAQAVGAIRSMGAQMVGAVMAIAGQMFNAGAQIVQRIAAGIRSAIGAVTSAISSVTAAVGRFLPGSPVAEGPLTVINSSGGGNPGYKIMEMIAAGMSASPIASAMGSALGGLAGAGAGAGVSPVGGGAGAVGGAVGGGITINYAPVINSGGTAGAGSDIMTQLREHSRELVTLIEQATSRRDRTMYSQ